MFGMGNRVPNGLPSPWFGIPNHVLGGENRVLVEETLLGLP